MNRTNVIDLNKYRPAAPFDWAAYERRAAVRLRRSQRRAAILAAAEAAVTGVIGVCVLVCTLLFFTML